MDRLLADLRHSLRLLRREPVFAAIAILTTALGVGANTAVFSLVSAVLLRPLPYGEPERVVMVWDFADEGGTTWLSRQEVWSLRRDAASYEHFGFYTTTTGNLTGEHEPERVNTAAVSANIFDALDVEPEHGRTFTAAEDAPGTDDVVLLGYALWQRRFGGSTALLGERIQVNGRSRTVVGVMGPDVRMPLDYREQRPTELWIPIALDPANLGGWGDRSIFGVGRLRAGIAPAAATAELERIRQQWVRAEYMREDPEGRFHRSAVPVTDLVTSGVRPMLGILLGAVGFVLLIACANVANLLLARSERRRREIAIRSAIGAGRGRVIGQLLTESVVVALIGGALGIGLALGAIRGLVALAPAGIPRIDQATLDVGVLAFSAALAMMTGLLFGLVPALHLSRPDLTGVLSDGGRSGTAGVRRARFRSGLGVVEIAFSVVLAVGALLLVRSFVELRRIDLGFDARSVLTARLALPQATYATPADVVALYERLVANVGELPGVQSAAAVRVLPLSGTIGNWSIMIEGQVRQPNDNPNGDWQVVTPEYFGTMRVPVVRGRLLSRDDDADGPMSVVINETMAERYWPGQDALGKRFHLGTLDQPWLTVVGIAGRVRHNAVIEEPRAEMYLTHSQFLRETGSAPRAMTLVIRTTADPLTVVPLLRQAVRTLDPTLPIADIQTMERVTANALSQPRFVAFLLGLFAALAVVLAAIGIYGIVSLVVSQRIHEIGIRMALGARSGAILRLILGQGLRLAVAGVALGLAGALVLTRFLERILYGVTPLDPLTFAVVPAVLGTVALFACLLPALRAASVDPVIALRDE